NSDVQSRQSTQSTQSSQSIQSTQSTQSRQLAQTWLVAGTSQERRVGKERGGQKASRRERGKRASKGTLHATQHLHQQNAIHPIPTADGYTACSLELQAIRLDSSCTACCWCVSVPVLSTRAG